MKTIQWALSALVLTAGVALAADQPPTTTRASCKADAAALCPGVQPGAGRVAACLKENEAKVSPACKDALAKMKDKKAQSKQGSTQ